jgi:hypothetical protein
MFKKKMNIIERLKFAFQNIVLFKPGIGGSNVFDAPPAYTSSNYDMQSGISFDKQMWVEARTRTLIGALSRDGAGDGAVTDMYAGSGPALDGSEVIKKVTLSNTNMITFTMREHMKGLPTYGDLQHPVGDPLSFKNLRAYVNKINAPTLPLAGEMAQLRANQSLGDYLNGSGQKSEILDWCAEEMEIQFIYSLIYGASPSILNAGSDCNLSLGINAGAGAGVPLMPRWFFDGQSGWATYSLTPATYNSTINSAINTIGTNAGAVVTLADLLLIRNKMDTEHFWPINFMGKKVRSIALCDPEIWHRIKSLLGTAYVYAMPRGEDNPYFGVDEVINYNGIVYMSFPNLYKLRPTYNSGSGVISGVADFGPSMAQDHRDYAVTSAIGLILFVGRSAAIEGINKAISTGVQRGKNDKGGEVWARFDDGFVRGEWYAKDGRSTSTDLTLVRNYSLIVGAWYEPGIGSGTGY